MSKEIKPDWRIVKVEQKSMCDKAWAEEKQIESCGVFYVVDFNLHIHICSLTPSLEAWPVQGYATFLTEEAREADEGEVEMEMLNTEEVVNYFGTEMESLPNKPLTDYIDLPEREEDDTDDKYRERVAEAAREYCCGNQVWF